MALPLLLMLECFVDVLYIAKYLSMPHPSCRLVPYRIRADSVVFVMRVLMAAIATYGWLVYGRRSKEVAVCRAYVSIR